MKWGRARLQAPIVTDEDAGQKRAAHLTNEELTRIFMQIQPTLERVIRRKIGDAQAAQDLAQDLYLRFQRIAAQLSGEDEARRYLMRMATNAAIDHLRSESYRMQLLVGALSLFENHDANPTRRFEAYEQHQFSHKDDPAHRFEVNEQYHLIDKALAELPPLCSDILYLSRIEGLTHPEIAEKLQLSVSSVEKYIMRALRHSRKRMEET